MKLHLNIGELNAIIFHVSKLMPIIIHLCEYCNRASCYIAICIEHNLKNEIFNIFLVNGVKIKFSSFLIVDFSTPLTQILPFIHFEFHLETIMER